MNARKCLSSIIVTCFLIISIHAFEAPFLSGHAGYTGDFTSDNTSKHFDPAYFSAGYFGGQINFFDTLVFRSDFSILTGDAFNGDILKAPRETSSIFSIKEISGTYRLSTGNLTHYFSLFYGEYDPIGSDIFLQRYFGVPKISSTLTESWTSPDSASLSNFYGGGISYVMRLDQPLAIGAYIYKDCNDYYDQHSLNFDLRIAGAFPLVTFDVESGIGLSSGSTDGTFEDYVLIVRETSFHAGFNILIDTPSEQVSVFTPAGFSNLIVTARENRNKDNFTNALDDLYFLIEPRVNLQKFSFALTFFNIPYSRIYSGDFAYINDPLGISATVYTNYFHIGDLNYTMGLHATLSLSERTIRDAIKDNSWNKNFYITPYADFPLFGGSLSTSLIINCTQLFKFEHNWFSSMDYRLGFRSDF